MNFSKLPGKFITKIGELENTHEPQVTIITPFYNGGKTLLTTANTILSQTYPFFEWIIIDDGSKDKDSLQKLADVEKMDNRIKVLHKENGGPSQARDYGIARASKSSKYIYFLDCDDLIENTMVETLYWTLETHPSSTWAYTSMINFGSHEYYWEPYLTIEEEKVRNLMCISSMIKKDDLIEVGCYGIKEKAMYEDWNLWLKLFSNKKVPIRTNAPLFWYRTSDTGELSRSRNNHAKAQKLIDQTAKKVGNDVEIIQFPNKATSNLEKVNPNNLILPDYKESNKILFLLNDVNVGLNNIYVYEIIESLKKQGYDSIVITTTPEINKFRQDFKELATEFYDLSNFLDVKDYETFINYIIASRKVNKIVANDTTYAYAIIPKLKEKYKKLETINLAFNSLEKYPDIYNIFDCILTNNESLATNSNKVRIISKEKNKKQSIKKSQEASKLREKFSFKENDIVVSFINSISYENRPKEFVMIAKILKNKKNLHFIMNGSGPMNNEIEEMINSLGLKDKIKLYSWNDMTEEEAFQISDITINCSLKEGINATNYKSIKYGVPTISVDLSNQKEYINEELGGLVEFNDCLSNEDYENDAKKYSDIIGKIILDMVTFKENVTNYHTQINLLCASFAKEILKDNSTSIENNFTNTLYENYLEKYKNHFNDKYLKYYTEVLHIIPREGIDNRKSTIIKRKIRAFSIKHNIENECSKALEILNLFIYTIVNLLRFIKNMIKSLIKLIPFVILLLKIISKLIIENLVKIKHKLEK